MICLPVWAAPLILSGLTAWCFDGAAGIDAGALAALSRLRADVGWLDRHGHRGDRDGAERLVRASPRARAQPGLQRRDLRRHRARAAAAGAQRSIGFRSAMLAATLAMVVLVLPWWSSSPAGRLDKSRASGGHASGRSAGSFAQGAARQRARSGPWCCRSPSPSWRRWGSSSIR